MTTNIRTDNKAGYALFNESGHRPYYRDREDL